MADKKAGTVSHYYDKIGVVIVDLDESVSIGDSIKFSGKSDEFSQTLESMEIDHEKIKKAKKGESVGIKTDQKVKEGDTMYLIEE